MKTKCDLILQNQIFRPNFLLCQQFSENIMLIINDCTVARYAMLEQMRNNFSTCPKHVNAIDEFAETYQPRDASHWYTKDSFLYRIINKILRQGRLEQCFLFRLYVSDLSEHLFQLKCQQQRNFTEINRNTILYRGLRQSQEHLQTLQRLVGQVILTKGFISTTRDKRTALFYAAPLHPQNPQSQALLIEISVDMTAPDIIVADIADWSQFPVEKEVLFDFGAKFMVKSLEYDKLHSMWYSQLIAVSSESQIISLAQHIPSHERCMDLNVCSEEEVKLDRMMSRERRRKFFPTPSNPEDDLLWNNSPSVPWIAVSISDQARVDYQKGMISWHRYSDVLQAYFDCKKAYARFKSGSRNTATDGNDIALFLNNLGFILRLLKTPNIAVKLLKKSSEIRNRVGALAHFRVQSLRNLGLAYTDKGDYENALTSLKQALIMGQQSIPTSQWSRSLTLCNFVHLYFMKGDYRQAIEFYSEALDAFEKCKRIHHEKMS